MVKLYRFSYTKNLFCSPKRSIPFSRVFYTCENLGRFVDEWNIFRLAEHSRLTLQLKEKMSEKKLITKGAQNAFNLM